MIGKAYEINDINISKSGEGYEIVLTDVDFREILTKEKHNDLGLFFRDYSSKIDLEGRIIKIKGLIISKDNISRANGINFLENMFNFSKSEKDEIKLKIIDDLDLSWETKVNILKPLYLKSKEDEYLGGTIEFEVILKSKDARLFSSKRKFSKGEEFMYGGDKLPTNGDIKLNKAINKISCNNLGNYKSPTIIEINVKPGGKINPPLIIKNITSGKEMILDISSESEDKIIIDGFSKKITKNGLDISYLKKSGSVFLYVDGKNDFGLYDKEGGHDRDFDIKIYFNDVIV